MSRLRKYPKTFGDWMYEMRKKKGWTQLETAQRAQCSKSFVSALERGESSSRDGRPPRPTPETVDKFAEAFGVDSSLPRLLLGYAMSRPISVVDRMFGEDEEEVSSGERELLVAKIVDALKEVGQKLEEASTIINDVVEQVHELDNK